MVEQLVAGLTARQAARVAPVDVVTAPTHPQSPVTPHYARAATSGAIIGFLATLCVAWFARRHRSIA